MHGQSNIFHYNSVKYNSSTGNSKNVNNNSKRKNLLRVAMISVNDMYHAHLILIFLTLGSLQTPNCQHAGHHSQCHFFQDYFLSLDITVNDFAYYYYN